MGPVRFALGWVWYLLPQPAGPGTLLPGPWTAAFSLEAASLRGALGLRMGDWGWESGSGVFGVPGYHRVRAP